LRLHGRRVCADGSAQSLREELIGRRMPKPIERVAQTRTTKSVITPPLPRSLRLPEPICRLTLPAGSETPAAILRGILRLSQRISCVNLAPIDQKNTPNGFPVEKIAADGTAQKPNGMKPRTTLPETPSAPRPAARCADVCAIAPRQHAQAAACRSLTALKALRRSNRRPSRHW